MVDPELALALSVQSNKGVYSLLLGSGASRSAGIPTGWEVVLDLIRKLARLESADCEPDPAVWYQQTFHQKPDYSKLLDEITHTSVERSQLLKDYFEPTEKEREEGQKRPTGAHRAIADLIARGFIRVIITTNFDRLMEQALSEIGLQPTIIASADAVSGALPLGHTRCTIIKINGDYLDTRFLNTNEELAAYPLPLERLLDQVFNEYGLIICGWSGDWDTALRAALERCPSRRFPIYWASRGEPSDRAKHLMTLRGASHIPISDADSFFRALLDKIIALDTFVERDPVSAKVAVARMKRYLTTEEHRISLHDLLQTEVSRAKKSICELPTPNGTVTPLVIQNRFRGHEAALHLLIPLLSFGSYWAEPHHDQMLIRSFVQIASEHESHNGLTRWIQLRHYPALLVLYSMGIAALAANNTRFLRVLLTTQVRLNVHKPHIAVPKVLNSTEIGQTISAEDLGGGKEYTPFNNHLAVRLRESFRELIPGDQTYDEMFDWWEYVLSMSYLDLTHSAEELAHMLKTDQQISGVPRGRFFCHNPEFGDGPLEVGAILQDGTAPSQVRALLREGFFSGEQSKYILLKEALERNVYRLRNHLGIS